MLKCIFLIAYFISALFSEPNTSDVIVYKSTENQVVVPAKPLNSESLQVRTLTNKKIEDWNQKEHQDSYQLLQKISHIWSDKKIADNYLIYGNNNENTFKWEIAPYKTDTLKFWNMSRV